MQNEGEKIMNIEVFSFGFKYGVPKDVNYIFDVRFLPNPYWEDHLRPKTGLVAEVADYVMQSKEAKTLLETLYPLLKSVIDQNKAAKKDCIKIGVGCTGGRHRSVAMVQKLVFFLHHDGYELSSYHRDIEKDSQ